MAEPSFAPMSEAQVIQKNAKNSLVSLKEALKTKDPWDRDVEFHRKDARRQYLHLIFMYPYSPQTLALDNPMWMETSHACITAYRQRIAALDKIVAERENKNGNPNGKNNSEKGKRSESGPVELRKLIQRFRQFLAEEEKFWIAFILRFARSFALDEVQSHIDALQLNRNTEDPSMRKNTFPEEGPPMPPSKAHREKKLAVLMKAFISLGDLARYREQYNERQGRPKAGSEEVLPRWATKSARKPGEVVPRPRNYARSLACYTQACSLLPDYGHAFHQLAILSSYQADTFGSILNYYRSICVKNSFAMGNENLHKTLGKAYDSFRNEPMEPIKDEDPARAIVDRFKKDVVVLHCLWKADKVSDAELSSHTQHTLGRFNKLLAERLLPIGLIVKIYIAALGALWTIRMTKHKKSNSSKEPASAKTPDTSREGIVLTHVMDLHLGFIKLAIAHLDPATMPSGTTPAEKIAVPLRRILQSLRVSSRWICSNLDYLYRSTNPDKAAPGLTKTMGEFWSSYALFLTSLQAAFPPSDLQSVATWKVKLSEDDDFAGFTPFKGSLIPAIPHGNEVQEVPISQCLPNEECLLRIRDVITDGITLVQAENTPLQLENGIFVLGTLKASPISSILPPQRDVAMDGVLPSTHGPVISYGQPEDKVIGSRRHLEEDDIASVSTDDPVTMAMHATLDQSGDDFDEEFEDEKILIPPNAWQSSDSRYDMGPLATPTSAQPPNGLAFFGVPIAPRDSPMTSYEELRRSSFPQQLQQPISSPRQDVFNLTASPYTGINPLLPPPASYYQDQPFSRLSIGDSPLQYNGPLNPVSHPMQTSPSLGILPVGSFGTPNLAQHRLSMSAGGSSRPPFDPAQPKTPPRTAQDLLLRVLGNTPQQSNGPIARPRHSTSPPRDIGSPPENRPPLLFGTSGGNSIWAP